MLGVVVLLHDPRRSLETLFLNTVIINWFNPEFIAPSMMAGRPGQDAAQQAQVMILSPCFTDGDDSYAGIQSVLFLRT